MRCAAIHRSKHRTCKRAARLGKPIRMTVRAGWGDGWMPFGFEQPVIGQTHQQRVKRAGFELRFLQQIIAVPPYVWPCDQRLEDRTCLLRCMRTPSHAQSSTYVDIGGQSARSQPQRDLRHSHLGTVRETAGAFPIGIEKQDSGSDAEPLQFRGRLRPPGPVSPRPSGFGTPTKAPPCRQRIARWCQGNYARRRGWSEQQRSAPRPRTGQSTR